MQKLSQKRMKNYLLFLICLFLCKFLIFRHIFLLILHNIAQTQDFLLPIQVVAIYLQQELLQLLQIVVQQEDFLTMEKVQPLGLLIAQIVFQFLQASRLLCTLCHRFTPE